MKRKHSRSKVFKLMREHALLQMHAEAVVAGMYTLEEAVKRSKSAQAELLRPSSSVTERNTEDS